MVKCVVQTKDGLGINRTSGSDFIRLQISENHQTGLANPPTPNISNRLYLNVTAIEFRRHGSW